MADRAAPYVRLLAPVALGLFAVILIAVILGGIAGSPSSEPGSQSSSGSASDKPQATSKRRRAPRRSSYTVKEGDSLGSISQRTGKSPQDLQDFNPGLDPQSLQPGQKLKLRG